MLVRRYNLLSFFCWLCVCTSTVKAQEYAGTTGMLHVPTAETGEAGEFKLGGTFVNKTFAPNRLTFEQEKYNTFCYHAAITPCDWMEVSIVFTLLKMHKNRDKNAPGGYYNQDRHIGLKLRPLKEGRWWPAIAIGGDDIEQWILRELDHHGGSYFRNLYAVTSKHFEWGGHELGLHLAYRHYHSTQKSNRQGIAGGLTYRPCFFRPLRLIGEWDGAHVNIGADCLLWRHLFAQICLTDGRHFSGGLSYYYTIPF